MARISVDEANAKRAQLQRIGLDAARTGNTQIAQLAAQRIRELNEEQPPLFQPGIMSTAMLTQPPGRRALMEIASTAISGTAGTVWGLAKGLPTALGGILRSDHETSTDPATGQLRYITSEERGRKAFDAMQAGVRQLTYVPRGREARVVNDAVANALAPLMSEVDRAITDGKWIPGWEGTHNPYMSEWIKTAFGAVSGGLMGRTLKTRNKVAQVQGDGYRLIPDEIEADAPAINRWASRFAGKDVMAQLTHLWNNRQTKIDAAEAAGLPEGQMPTRANLRRRQDELGAPYEALRASPLMIDFDRTFQAAINNIDQRPTRSGTPSQSVWEQTRQTEIDDLKARLLRPSTIHTMATSADDALNMIDELRESSAANFASGGEAELRIGRAQRRAADAIEDRLQASAQRSLTPELYDQYVAARRQKAIIHMIRAATDNEGRVSADKISELIDDSNIPEASIPPALLRIKNAYDNFPSSMKMANTSLDVGRGATKFEMLLAPVFASSAGFALGGIPGIAAGLGVLYTLNATARALATSKLPTSRWVSGGVTGGSAATAASSIAQGVPEDEQAVEPGQPQ